MQHQFKGNLFNAVLPPAAVSEEGCPTPDTTRQAPEEEANLDLEMAYSSLASGTARQYRLRLAKLDRWLGPHELTDRRLALYLREQDKAGLAPTTIKNFVAAVSFRSKALEQTPPVGKYTTATLRRIVRDAAGRGRGKAKGLRRDEVERMASYCEGLYSLQGLRDAALFSVMFDGLLRVSEAHGLNVEDLRETDSGEGLNVVIKRSKVDQEAKGAVVYIGPAAANRVWTWIERAGIESGSLFPAFHNQRIDIDKTTGTPRRLGCNGLAAAVKKAAKACGIQGPVRSHSFRRGMAMELTANGASLQEVADAGRWTTLEMVLEYTKGQRAEQGAVAKLYAQRPTLRAVKSA